jgi:uncharacterized protein YjiS (DUF1127 family)
MSCGSTTSTNTQRAASLVFPGLGRSCKTLLAWLAKIALWWVWRPEHRQLHELDDWLLADIGVSRTTAEEARRSELYQSAWRDSK